MYSFTLNASFLFIHSLLKATSEAFLVKILFDLKNTIGKENLATPKIISACIEEEYLLNVCLVN